MRIWYFWEVVFSSEVVLIGKWFEHAVLQYIADTSVLNWFYGEIVKHCRYQVPLLAEP